MMMYIRRLIINNFKGIKNLDIQFNKGINILVGANGIGKSTILEAIELATKRTFRGQAISEISIDPYWFNVEHLREIENNIKKKKKSTNLNLLQILIEVYLEPEESEDLEKIDGHIIAGKNNSLRENTYGMTFMVQPREDMRVSLQEYLEELILRRKKPLTPHTLPLEYFEFFGNDFSGNGVSLREINPKPILIKPFEFLRNISYKYYSMVNSISDGIIPPNVTYEIYREVNNILTEKLNKSLDKKYKIGIIPNPTTFLKRTIVLQYHDIPFHYLGAGEQIQHQLRLQLNQIRGKFKEKIQKYEISIPTILMEEPESHLSYMKLEELLSLIKKYESNHGIQFIITTHNSIVANRLGLKNLILLRRANAFTLNSVSLKELNEDTQAFFKIRADTNILRLLFANKILLVEGPSDKLIVEACFYSRNKRMPQQKGIEILEVGTSFKRYIDVFRILDSSLRSIGIVTDNDNRQNEKLEEYESLGVPRSQIFIPPDSEGTNLEEAFFNINSSNKDLLQSLLDLRNSKDILTYMRTNKTEWSFKIFTSLTYPQGTRKAKVPYEQLAKIKFPSYISNAVIWLANT